ncbi:serine hydrolase domain-containing protein [Marinobacter sp. X15-166B]|uniref:serine hydrolase domain-containing protein n=1 Tax=Marinobacter sp. X15-166B TaxID=1897620 RepID=UPI00085C2E65|nr:serine hydrolase [Marinobacter sp. X15-166B]OEY66288.1 6-aminohexanoate hydrolase [Marinobacter sp. X15-166B]
MNNKSKLRLLATSWLLGACTGLLLSGGALAATTAQPATPWMSGFPPADDRLIRNSDRDYFAGDKLRWTVCHLRELFPSKVLHRGLGAPVNLDYQLDPAIAEVTFTPTGTDTPMSWDQAFDANHTDGVIVLHDGKVVYERYAGCLDEMGTHAAMSMTKSLTGLLAETLIAEGVLDEAALAGELIPELQGSAFGTATLRQILDMTTSLKFNEDYSGNFLDPDGDLWKYSTATSPMPQPESYQGPRSFFGYLQTVPADGAHGEAFAYKTINTDALGWIIARASGKSVSELLSERIWQRMGAEQSAYFTIDSIGTPFAGGGLNAGLRDLARIGQLMLNEGKFNGEQLVPAAAVRNIRQGGDPALFAKAGYTSMPNGSYRSMWWFYHNDNEAYAARGVHGQTIYIDPTARMVIVRLASHPKGANAHNDPTSLPAYQAVADYLTR